MENPPFLDKFKSHISKRGRNLYIYHNKTVVARHSMTQHFDPYDLYAGFEDEDYEV